MKEIWPSFLFNKEKALSSKREQPQLKSRILNKTKPYLFQMQFSQVEDDHFCFLTTQVPFESMSKNLPALILPPPCLTVGFRFLSLLFVRAEEAVFLNYISFWLYMQVFFNLQPLACFQISR